MLSNIQFWEQLSVFILYFFVLFKPISSQGLSCYKCMTTNPNDDGCRDPFSSLINPVQINCQVQLKISFCLSNTYSNIPYPHYFKVQQRINFFALSFPIKANVDEAMQNRNASVHTIPPTS